MFSLLRRASKGIPNLDAKSVVITGAADGIGRALAFELASKGCNLALVDMNKDGLTLLSSELEIWDGRILTTHVADVADRERMKSLAAEVAAEHQAIHVLINNAGIAYEAPFPQTPLEDWDRIIDVNLRSVIYACHFFMPYLAKVDRAHIVNLSSLFGIVGMAGQSAYCATKFAVRGFSEALWEELRATSVGVTVVHPGAIATNIIKRAKGDDPEVLKRVSDWYEGNGMPPEKAAAQIVRALEKGKPRLLITRDATLGDWIKRLMPVFGNKLFGDAVIRELDVEDVRQKRADQWQETMVDDG